MTTVSVEAIERFMKGQVKCWNSHDREGLMALYREMASDSLVIEYAGRTDQRDGWFIMEEMYDKHNDQVTLEVVETIINGSEAAIHHRNRIIGTDLFIESIETYTFEPGKMTVRYYLKPPATNGLNLENFRGLAANPS